MQVKVFGMENCSGCTTVKAVLKDLGVRYVEYDVMDVEHMAAAQSYGVRSVPTTVVRHGEGEEVFVGSSSKTIELIKIATGN